MSDIQKLVDAAWIELERQAGLDDLWVGQDIEAVDGIIDMHKLVTAVLEVAVDAPMEMPKPEDRPNGLEVLAFHRGKWTHVRWSEAHQMWSLGRGAAMIHDADRAFAPLPQKPDGAEDFGAYYSGS